MGKISYYRRFIQNFSHKSACLYDLLGKNEGDDSQGPKRKNEPIELDEEQLAAFRELRQALVTAPILAYPDFNSKEPFILDTDWSTTAIGAVLSQVQEGEERVISYGARKLCKREQSYSSNKGEILAVIHFIRTWKYYLRSRPFILRSDHKALNWIRTMEEPAGMIQRWIDILSNYEFQVQFRKGKNHGNADFLSRCEHAPSPTPEEEEEAEEEAVAELNQFQSRPEKRDDISELRSIIAPDQLSHEDIRRYQEQDPNLKHVKNWIKRGEKPDLKDIRKEDIILKQYLSIFETLYESPEGMLFRSTQDPEPWPQDRLCLPEAMQLDAISNAHCLLTGHMGIQNTQRRLLQRYYFPGLYKAVEDFVRSCKICQLTSPTPKAQKHTLEVVQEGEPWQKLSIDLLGEINPPSRRGNIYLLTCKCTFTRWIEAIPIPDFKASTIATALEREIFSRYGLPQQLHSDNAKYFNSELMEEVCHLLNIKKTNCPPYSPKSNVVERTHKDLNRLLRTATVETGQDWEEILPSCLLALRTARNRMTGVTPYYAMFGREAYVPLDIIYPAPENHHAKRTVHTFDLNRRMRQIFTTMREKLGHTIERARMNYSGQLGGRPLQLNDLVWLFTPLIKKGKSKKLQTYWTGPWIISKKISNVLFHIQTHGNWNRRPLTIVASIDRLKRYLGNEDTGFTNKLKLNLAAQDVTLEDEFIEQSFTPPQNGLPSSPNTPPHAIDLEIHESDFSSPPSSQSTFSSGPVSSSRSPSHSVSSVPQNAMNSPEVLPNIEEAESEDEFDKPEPPPTQTKEHEDGDSGPQTNQRPYNLVSPTRTKETQPSPQFEQNDQYIDDDISLPPRSSQTSSPQTSEEMESEDSCTNYANLGYRANETRRQMINNQRQNIINQHLEQAHTDPRPPAYLFASANNPSVSQGIPPSATSIISTPSPTLPPPGRITRPRLLPPSSTQNDTSRSPIPSLTQTRIRRPLQVSTDWQNRPLTMQNEALNSPRISWPASSAPSSPIYANLTNWRSSYQGSGTEDDSVDGQMAITHTAAIPLEYHSQEDVIPTYRREETPTHSHEKADVDTVTLRPEEVNTNTVSISSDAKKTTKRRKTPNSDSDSSKNGKHQSRKKKHIPPPSEPSTSRGGKKSTSSIIEPSTSEEEDNGNQSVITTTREPEDPNSAGISTDDINPLHSDSAENPTDATNPPQEGSKTTLKDTSSRSKRSASSHKRPMPPEFAAAEHPGHNPRRSERITRRKQGPKPKQTCTGCEQDH